jgi:group I intron endonuclease
MAVVYALECSVNGHAYIGVTSGNLRKRFREHRCLCNTGKHHAAKLVADWQRYGESAFLMKVLEETEYSHRGAHCEAEQKWIDLYAEQDKLYNAKQQSAGLTPEQTAKGIEASRTVAGNRWTPEANEKRRLAQLGKPKGHGAKISATKLAKKLLMI